MTPSENSVDLIKQDKETILKFVNDLRCIQCDHYVNSRWSAYDGKVYCQDCWDYNRQEEEQQRQKEIAKLKARLSALEKESESK